MGSSERFGVGLPRIPLPRATVENRTKVVLELARGRRVLHVGCSDSPYFEEQHARGTLLHAELRKVSRALFGVDISKEGVAYLNRVGFENIICSDVEQLERCGLSTAFDLVVAGELIEHLPNPVRALQAMKGVLAPNGEILISVPNAFSAKGLLRTLAGIEAVHQDHCYYFSPATMQRLMRLAGLRIIDLRYYSTPASSKWRAFIDASAFALVRKIWPWLSEGILVRAVAIDI